MKKIKMIMGIMFILGVVWGGIFMYKKSDWTREVLRQQKEESIPEEVFDNIIEGGNGEVQDLKNKSMKKNNINKKNNFYDDFEKKIIIEESGRMENSASDSWWLNSGAYFVQRNGVGRTLRGSLSERDKWRKKYSKVKSVDTGDGYHPQNIFRLITRSRWQNFSEEVYFKITYTQKTEAKERKDSNGILLFSRYGDQNNLYYAGIRVDGQAVIKKKKNGLYTTLASKVIYPGEYNREKNINLVPLNKWVGLRVITEDVTNGTSIKLFMDMEKNGQWEEILQVIDGETGRLAVFNGFAGIRTDFMDVEFDDYRLKEL